MRFSIKHPTRLKAENKDIVKEHDVIQALVVLLLP